MILSEIVGLSAEKKIEYLFKRKISITFMKPPGKLVVCCGQLHDGSERFCVTEGRSLAQALNKMYIQTLKLEVAR